MHNGCIHLNVFNLDECNMSIFITVIHICGLNGWGGVVITTFINGTVFQSGGRKFLIIFYTPTQ